MDTKRARLAVGFTALVCLLTVGSTIAGAEPGIDSIPVNSPDNETAQAWFVQFSGPAAAQGGNRDTLKTQRQAFYANAATMGLTVTQRQAFGTLWNGVSVNVPAPQASDLLSVPGVVAVYPVRALSLPPTTASSEPDDVGSNPMIGVDPTNGGVAGFDGHGVKVAVIDSGIDYTNPDLGGCFGPGCKVAGGFDLVGDSYDDTSTDPGYQPIPHPDPDPAPCDPNIGADGGHGTHVAGIIGAKAAGPNGVTGVAPGVTLLAYRVFGCNGSTANDNVVAALELAYTDGAQVVNMSLGDDYASWPEEPTAQVSDLLASKGVVVVAAEGNAGGVNTGLFSGGDPGVGNGVIAVASFDNKKLFLPYFKLADSRKYGWIQAAAAPAPPTSGSAPIVTVPGTIGCAPEAPGSLSGKIALIRRGTCTFYVKASNAQKAGAIGVVLYNNASGFVSPTVAGSPPITIPVVAVSLEEGTAIRAAIAAGNGALTWTSNSDYFSNPTGGLLSSFSSWGPTAELTLKPDLGAPGGFIRSTWPMTQFGGHNVISGTSMATPHVAGAAAILLQAGKAPSLVRDLLSNYAEPQVWSGNRASGLLESPLREGAGLIKVDRAVAATVLVQPAKLSLGEGTGGVRTLSITNSGASAVTYDLSATNAISPSTAGVGAAWPNSFGLDLPGNGVTFSQSTVTVPAGGQATVVASIAADPAAPTGEMYDGYIQLTPTDGGHVITVPYAGFKGDYQSLQVLTPTVNGFPWLAKQVGSNLVKQGAGATYTLQGNDVPLILVHLNIPARKLNVQVENADGSFVQPVFNYASKEEFLSRNSSTTGFFVLAWDGTRGQDNGNNKRKVVPDGQYMLKLSVLKPLGDESNPADWETFTTPVFTLARP